MKQARSQVTEKPAVCVNPDTAKVRIGAMTPSFPPAKLPQETSKD
jgi:hypothetical protein